MYKFHGLIFLLFLLPLSVSFLSSAFFSPFPFIGASEMNISLTRSRSFNPVRDSLLGIKIRISNPCPNCVEIDALTSLLCRTNEYLNVDVFLLKIDNATVNALSNFHAGSPVNSFNSIINPLFKSLDYDVPKFTISVKHALLMSQICWFVWMFLYPWLNHSWVPGPLLLPAEVYKIGVTHYFSYLKAKEELGYVPMISPREGLAKTISYWKDRKRRELDRPNIFMWIYVIFGMTGLFYTAFLPTFWPLRWLNSLALFIFRSVWNLRFTFYLAVLVHLGEAIYVWFRARRLDPANATGWFWQTFILGFASMKLFIKRAKQA